MSEVPVEFRAGMVLRCKLKVFYSSYFFCLDGLVFGVWKDIESIQNPKLKTNASQLPTLLQAGYADSTLSKYKPAWLKWLDWAKEYEEVNPCPADPFSVALYFNELVMLEVPRSAIISAYSGIRWGHINSGYDPPTDHPFVKLAFECAKRLTGKTDNQNYK